MIRAADWNQIQIEGRIEIEQHDHTGAGKGTPLGTNALADGAVTGAKIADGALTADKFDPNLDLSGSIDDGTITTVMLADGAVHAQKIAPGSIDSSRLAATQSLATLDVGDVLRLRASSIRAEYDALGFDWGWQLGPSIVGIPSPPLDYPIHARLIELDTVIQTIPDAMLPAIRVVSDILEPELIRSLGGAAAAWAALAGDDAWSMLAWAGVPNVPVALAHAFAVVDLAWNAYLEDGFLYPNLLLALARSGRKSIVAFATQATTLIELLTLFEGGPFGQCFDELLAGTMRPLGTLDSGNNRPIPPLLQLDPDERFASSVFEVDAELGVRTIGYVMAGIGSAELPPPPGHWRAIASPRSNGAAGLVPVIRAQLRRAMAQLGQARTARLWGVTWRSGLDETIHHEALLSLRMRGRTIGLRPALATGVEFPVVHGLVLPDPLIKGEAPGQAVDMLGFGSDLLPLLQAPEAPVLALNISQVKRFDFSWAPANRAQYYQLFERAKEGEPFVQIGSNMTGLATSQTVPLHFRLHASYKLRACNGSGYAESEVVNVVGPLVAAIGYFKASNTDAGDQFGCSISLSGDGNTLAVGAYGEASSATGIGGDQADNSASNAGAVYVFVRAGQNVWSQQAYIKASNTGAGDLFGAAVALSGDGSTLAVGAHGEASNGDQNDDSMQDAGAVYVYVRDAMNVWTQQSYIKASNPDAVDYFGVTVRLSGDGSTLAVGAWFEDSAATGIGGDQADNSASNAGAVYVFVRDESVWSQEAYIKASNTGDDNFGLSVTLSGDGNTLAVGAFNEDSSATGIDGDQADNSATEAGAVYVFVRDGNHNWSQQAYIKASNTDAGDQFGVCVALGGDGSTLAVGARSESSSTTGIGGNQADNSAPQAGAVYVFVRDSQNAWSQQAYLKASNTGAGDLFGFWVALSGDGDTLAVGAQETSSTTGIGGTQADDSATQAGAVYVFVRDGQNAWSQTAYVKASNTGAGDVFGTAALSGDGHTLAIGAGSEASNAIGIGGNQTDNSAPGAGAVYLY